MTLRARVLVGMGVIAVVLVMTSFFITRATESYLIERVDAQLVSAGPPLRDFGSFDDPTRSVSSVWVGAVAADGTVSTIVTPRLGGVTDLPVVDPATAAAEAAKARPVPFTAGSQGDTRYRVVVFHEPRLGRTLLIGLPLTDVDAAITRLVAVEAVATITTLAILGLVAWWVIHLGVRPIKRMTETATAIADGELSHRVPDVAAGTEAGELGVALNAMLGRIEAAFEERSATEERLRRFAADASHELRTPVTTIRGYAELYRTGALSGDGELDAAMGRTEQEAIRMGALIEDLLLLARLDQGRPLALGDVDLGAVAADAVADAHAVQPARRITAQTAPGVVVRGDEHRLRQVVANLVGNALVHTTTNSAVTVRVAAEDGQGILEVADEGPGMSPEVEANVFERFYRADPSRARRSGGAGLGLSIVAAIVAAHGGTVTIDSQPERGTTARVSFALAAAPAAPAAGTLV